MKKSFLIFFALFFSYNLFAENLVEKAFGNNEYFYYCEKYNSITKVSCKAGKVYYQDYSIRNNSAVSGTSYSEEIDPTLFEISENKVVSIIYQDTKMVLTDINNISQIVSYLNNAAYKKVQKIMGTYHDKTYKQTISLSESNGKFILKISKADGKIIEDVFDQFYDSGVVGKEYSLFFGDSYIELINIKEAREQEMDYQYEFSFPLPYEKVSYFIKPAKIKASSTLIEKNKAADFYSENNLFEGSWKSWVEGKNDDGIGESITFEFEKPVSIFHIGFRNGYGDLRYFYANNRVKVIEVLVNNTIRQEYTLKDWWGFQTIRLNQNDISSLKIQIKDVYHGTRYKDTCISEIYLQRDAYVSDYDLPDFEFDSLTTECIKNFPQTIYKSIKNLPLGLFYTQDGIPLMLNLSNPTNERDIYIFKNLDFYVYNPTAKSWKKDSTNPIFAEINPTVENAIKNKFPMTLGFDDSRHSLFYIVSVSNQDNYLDLDFDGFKFYKHVDEIEPYIK